MSKKECQIRVLHSRFKSVQQVSVSSVKRASFSIFPQESWVENGKKKKCQERVSNMERCERCVRSVQVISLSAFFNSWPLLASRLLTHEHVVKFWQEIWRSGLSVKYYLKRGGDVVFWGRQVEEHCAPAKSCRFKTCFWYFSHREFQRMVTRCHFWLWAQEFSWLFEVLLCRFLLQNDLQFWRPTRIPPQSQSVCLFCILVPM